MNPERVSAQHPAARARGDDLGLTARRIGQRSGIARSLGVIGPETAVAMATMAVRGREHRTRAQFALAYGISEDLLAQLERGVVPVAQVPATLLHLTPLGQILGGWPEY